MCPLTKAQEVALETLKLTLSCATGFRERGTHPSLSSQSARTLMVRPLRDGLNSTMPARVAKIV